MKPINEELLDLGRAQYRAMSGWDDLPRDKDGFVILRPTAAHVDKKMSTLTADIGSLEAKLKKYKEEQAKTIKYTKTEEYKESKKQMSKKKQKKKRESLLNMVFNNADAEAEDAEAEDEEYDDEDGSGYIEKKAKKSGKKSGTTLETTYGKRFSPVVSMLYDTITEFDAIAAEIEQDLKDNKNSSRTMYRSSQIGNMISAKNSKLSAVKELAAVAKTLSDLEYKQAKDKKDAEGADQNKAVANMAAKFLRGGLDDLDSDSGKKGKKSGKKDKDKDKKSKKPAFGAVRGISALDDTDDDEEYGSIKRSKSDDEDEQRALAAEFAKTLQGRKKDIKLTNYEKHIRLEGTYTVMVVVDPMRLEDWRFVAVSNSSGKILHDDEYKELLPKKKKCRMSFDLSKGRCTDKNSARTYKLLYKD